MSEVFASNEAVIELLDPITGSTLYTVQYTRDLSLSERPVYVDRAFARSGAVTSHRLRSKGSVTLRKDAESLDLVRELKRWQQGVTYYALTSDLKGKTYRHPNLRITMTNADGTVERQVAYGVRLSDRTLSRPDGGVVGDSISLDVLRGFDLSATEAADSGRPMRALDFARTGNGTYINASGTLSTATDGQARIGVPYGTYSASKAGLVLEGAGTNLVYNSSAQVDTAGWSNGGNPNSVNRATTASCPTISTAIYCTYPGSGVAMLRTTPEIACVAGDVFTVSGWFYKDPGVGGARWRLFWSNSGNSAEYSPSSAGAWQWMTATFTIPAGVTSLSLQYFADGGSAGSNLYVTDLQIEKSPFATSIIRTTTGAATRSPDLCGIAPGPHNLLKYSEQTDQTSAWNRTSISSVATGQLAPDNTATAVKFIPSASAAARIEQPIAPTGLSGKTYTLSVWLKADVAHNGRLEIYDGTTSQGLKTVPITTSWQRFETTGTMASNATVVDPAIYFDTSAGGAAVYVWGAQLVEGSHPGFYVRTTDTAIPAPTSPALDPAWQQSGRISFRSVTPFAWLKKIAYFGCALNEGPVSASQLGIGRVSTDGSSTFQVYVCRQHNGSTGTNGIAGSAYAGSGNIDVWDNAPHDWIVEWTNYTLDGVRYMYLRLYVDSVLKVEFNVAALYGATAWATIDPSKLISDSNTFATLSSLKLGYPTLPAGSIPA